MGGEEGVSNLCRLEDVSLNGIPATVYCLVPRGVEVSPFGWMTVVMDRPLGGVLAFA